MKTLKARLINFQSVFLVSLLLFSLFTRFYKLDTIPPHLTPDEASLGYNAFSILNSLRDEHGKLLPIVFESFGDWKPGLYVYLSVIPVYLFGLNEFSTRFASALFGSISPIILFFIVKNLSTRRTVGALPFLASLFLSVTPWHIHFSRGAWEAQVSLSITLMGVLLFLYSLKKEKLLVLSALMFSLTLLTYQGAKLSTPLVVFALLLVFRRKFVKIKMGYILTSAALGLIVSFPIILSVFTGQAGRLSVFSVFNFPRPDEYTQNFISQTSTQKGSLFYNLYYSENYHFLRGVLGRFFNHFSYRFLFSEGDFQNPRHSSPYTGQLLIGFAPFIVMGMFSMARNFRVNKAHQFFFFWAIFSVLPSILSRDQVHSVRAIALVVPLVYVASIGVMVLLDFLKNFKFLGLALTFGIVVVSFGLYADRYLVQLSNLNSKYWQWGYKQAVLEISNLKSGGEAPKVVFEQSYAQPYIYFFFYNKTKPAEAWRDLSNGFVRSKSGDVGLVKSIEGVSFEYIDWQVARGRTGEVFVGSPMAIPVSDTLDANQFQVISEIPFLDNKEISLRIVKIK